MTRYINAIHELSKAENRQQFDDTLAILYSQLYKHTDYRPQSKYGRIVRIAFTDYAEYDAITHQTHAIQQSQLLTYQQELTRRENRKQVAAVAGLIEDKVVLML